MTTPNKVLVKKPAAKPSVKKNNGEVPHHKLYPWPFMVQKPDKK